MIFQVANKKESIDALLSSYAKTKDWRIRNRIIESYYPFIKQMSKKISQSRAHYRGSFLEEDDITSLVSMGFLNSLERYNPERGVNFLAYAQKRMKGAFLDEERTLYHFKRIKEGMPEVKRRFVFTRMNFSENDSYIPPVKTNPLDNLLHKEYQEFLRKIIGKTFALYYLDGFNLKEIGEILGVTKSAVCFEIKKDMPIVREKLRKFIRSYNDIEINESSKKRTYHRSIKGG